LVKEMERMTEYQENETVEPVEPVQGEAEETPTHDETSHDYREVEDGVQARNMTDEEREQRSNESSDEGSSEE
jgi:hypothetical protein